VRSIALFDFQNAEKNVSAKVQEPTQIERLDQPRRWAALVLPVFALLLWLAAGCLLTWLVADFDRTLAPAKSNIPPWLIFSLCLGPVIIVGWLFFRSWKRSPSASGIRE